MWFDLKKGTKAMEGSSTSHTLEEDNWLTGRGCILHESEVLLCTAHSQRFGILQGAGPNWNYWSGRESVNRGHVDGGIDECREESVERFAATWMVGSMAVGQFTWRAWSGWSCPLLLNTTWK